MNQYTFNLETNYLQHDKLGAHYSKNWDKKKQDEYNAWYYKTHKNKWKEINEEKLATARWNKDHIPKYEHFADTAEEMAKAEKHDADAYEYAKGNKLERQYGYENFAKPNGETFSQHTKNMRAAQKQNEKAAKSYRREVEKMKNPKTAGYTESSNQAIKGFTELNRMERSDAINMMAFDAYRAKKRVSSALNKLKNVKL